MKMLSKEHFPDISFFPSFFLYMHYNFGFCFCIFFLFTQIIENILQIYDNIIYVYSMISVLNLLPFLTLSLCIFNYFKYILQQKTFTKLSFYFHCIIIIIYICIYRYIRGLFSCMVVKRSCSFFLGVGERVWNLMDLIKNINTCLDLDFLNGQFSGKLPCLHAFTIR